MLLCTMNPCYNNNDAFHVFLWLNLRISCRNVLAAHLPDSAEHFFGLPLLFSQRWLILEEMLWFHKVTIVVYLFLLKPSWTQCQKHYSHYLVPYAKEKRDFCNELSIRTTWKITNFKMIWEKDVMSLLLVATAEMLQANTLAFVPEPLNWGWAHWDHWPAVGKRILLKQSFKVA